MVLWRGCRTGTASMAYLPPSCSAAASGCTELCRHSIAAYEDSSGGIKMLRVQRQQELQMCGHVEYLAECAVPRYEHCASVE